MRPEIISRDCSPDELELFLGHGDSSLGKARLDFFKSIALPAVPDYVLNRCAVNLDGRWTRVPRDVDKEQLLAHFHQQSIALGGIYAVETPVLVFDLDNESGPNGKDADLDLRKRLVELVAPKGFWVRSSRSGGLHRWVVLDRAIAPYLLGPLAARRLKECLHEVPELHRNAWSRSLINNESAAGVPKWIEIMPYQGAGKLGAVIRAPFGPGSALLNEQDTITDPGECLGHMMSQLERQGPSKIESLFPGYVATQLSFAGEPARTETAFKRKVVSTRNVPRDLKIAIGYCDGRRPRALRPSMDVCKAIARRAWHHGTPIGMRHASTFLLALDCSLSRVPLQDAQDKVLGWLFGPALPNSKEAQRSAPAATIKTKSIVRYVYSYWDRRGMQRPRSRWRDPAPLRADDLKRLRGMLGDSIPLLALAVRTLGFARANHTHQIKAYDSFLCELPVNKIGVKTSRARRLFFRLIKAGILSRVRDRIPRYRKGQIPGIHNPQEARPRLYRVNWRFATRGRFVRYTQLVSFPYVVSRNSSSIRVGSFDVFLDTTLRDRGGNSSGAGYRGGEGVQGGRAEKTVERCRGVEIVYALDVWAPFWAPLRRLNEHEIEIIDDRPIESILDVIHAIFYARRNSRSDDKDEPG